MAIRFFLFVLFCSSFFMGRLSAQSDSYLDGRVTDETGSALAYVNIGVVGTSVGTVSDEQGRFRLYLRETLTAADTLRFSSIGYLSRSFLLADYLGKTTENLQVTLPAAAHTLPEVVVMPRFTQRKQIGMERPGTRMSVNFAIAGKPNQNLGAEVGRKFNLPRRSEVRLDTFRFFIAQNNFDTVGLRIHVYELAQGEPGANLLRKSLIVSLANRAKGWISVDLLPYDLIASDDVVVSVEWIYYRGKGNALNIPIAIPSAGTHFYKYGSQARWKKFPGMSAAFSLDVSY
jgi:hypothetical protein